MDTMDRNDLPVAILGLVLSVRELAIRFHMVSTYVTQAKEEISKLYPPVDQFSRETR